MALIIVWAMPTVVARAETTLERALRTSSIKIGYGDVVPFAYTSSDGKPTGEAPEIAKHILAKMGISNVIGVAAQLGSLTPELMAGRFDILATGWPISPALCEEIHFSEPTYSVGQALLVPKGNPRNLKTYDDLVLAGDAVLGVVGGGIEERYALLSKVPAHRLVAMDDMLAGVDYVASGKIDAFAVNSLAAGKIVREYAIAKEIEQAEPFGTVAGQFVQLHGAFGFRKDDVDFLKEFNKYLVPFIGTPEHLELVKRFGITETEFPEVTTAKLCSMPPTDWPIPPPPPPPPPQPAQ